MKLSDDLQKKLEQLEAYEDAYYNKDPLISDAAYDLFKDRVVKQLPPDHPYFKKVGHTPVSNWPKEKHTIFMGSQNKVCTVDEIIEWVKKVRAELGIEKIDFILQHKLDGFSLEVKYKSKKLDKAVTRGDGIIGEDITQNARHFRKLPTIIPVDGDVVVRGEGLLTKNSYEIIQKNTNDHYKNARNAASGISRRYDGTHSEYIQVLCYDINARVKKESEKIEILKKLGFTPVKTYLCKGLKDIIGIYKEIRDNKRETYPYGIDGLVLKIDEIDLQDRLGVKENRPDHQIALKFDSEQEATVVRDIVIQIGRTGKLTPVAILEPVDLMGSTVSKATLHNFSYISENQIGKGAEVAIEKKGDIIPQVVEVVFTGDKYAPPEKCPSCGSVIKYDGVNGWCTAEVCRQRDINRIVYWIQTIDMKNFSRKFVERLWDLGKVRSVSDIYRLQPDDFTGVEGIGGSTIKKFFKTIEDTSEMFLEKFITALGIPSCSKSTAEVLVEKFGDWKRISEIKSSDLEKIPGFAKISSENICRGIKEVDSMARSLLEVIKIKKKKQGSLTGLSFCVTGSLETMGRKEFYEMIVENGGIAKNSVSDGLDYLITNDPTSGSSKNRKAQKYGVKIATEDEFYKILGKSPQKKSEDKEEKSKESGIKIVSENIFE